MSSTVAILRRIRAVERRLTPKQAKAVHVVLCNQDGELLPGHELPSQALSYLKRILLTHRVSYE